MQALKRYPCFRCIETFWKLPRSITTQGHGNETPKKKVVFISQSTDVLSNLAFEDWLYRNWSFDQRHILLLWRNSPCVVIGRHQNTYIEANLPYLKSAGIPVVRRNSGGGAVYHDEGNLNCTFFTTREKYNRRWNLDLIVYALQSDFGIATEVSKRDDICIGNNYKVSGSASKLGRLCAYHHLCILVSSNKQQLKLALQGDKSITSNATPSTPSPVANLRDYCEDITVEKLLGSVAKYYLMKSIDMESSMSYSNYQQSYGFTLINPTEEWFPGIDKIKKQLSSWEWFSGMNPRFYIRRVVPVPEALGVEPEVEIEVQSFHGKVESIKLAGETSPQIRSLMEGIEAQLVGGQYSSAIFSAIENKILLSCSYEDSHTCKIL